MSLNQPLLPYAGTSGWSGSETSHDRAKEQDSNGTTLNRQKITLELLDGYGFKGMTWKELSDATGWHHGSASGVLSVLHKEGLIDRLMTKRDKCAIYVLPSHVYTRPTAKRKVKTCRHCGNHL